MANFNYYDAAPKTVQLPRVRRRQLVALLAMLPHTAASRRNKTTLGSGIPLPGDDWRALLNSIPNETGPFLTVTEVLSGPNR